MPKNGEPSVHFSLLIITPNGEIGPTMGNYDTLQEAVYIWVENYTEAGPDIGIVRVFSVYDAKAQIYEVTHMEAVSEEEVESVQVNEMSNTSFDDLVMDMNETDNFVADEHPDWTINEFQSIILPPSTNQA